MTLRPSPMQTLDARPAGRTTAGRLARCALAAPLATLLALMAGCAGLPAVPGLPGLGQRPAAAPTPAGAPAPLALPAPATPAPPKPAAVLPAQRSLTPFTGALACMDTLMADTGVRDLSLMMEDLRDGTQRVPVSVRDMMTSALSDMSRRSRALSLSLVGSDQANLQQLRQALQPDNPFGALPQYNLRGSISQLDEDVERSNRSLGVLGSLVGLRLGSETRRSVLGFDAALVDTASFRLVPGVTSRNTVSVTRRERGAGDGQAQLQSANLVFAFSTTRSEGVSQAARGMVELAAVELVGKLARLPYWRCLGLPDSHPEVQRELDDWAHGASVQERVSMVQTRLRAAGWYDGPADGRSNPALQAAVARALEALGTPGGAAPANRAADALATDSAALMRWVLATPLPQAGTADVQGTPGAASRSVRRQAAPVQIRSTRLAATGTDRAEGAGTLRLDIQAREPGYLYCYATDPASGTIRRVFPNRHDTDPAVLPGRPLKLPVSPRVRLPANQPLACVFTPREVYAQLPSALRWGDFQPVRMESMDAIAEAFGHAGGVPATLIPVASAAGTAAD